MIKMFLLLLLVVSTTVIIASEKDAIVVYVELDYDTIQTLHDVEIVGHNAKTIAGSGQFINARTLAKTN